MKRLLLLIGVLVGCIPGVVLVLTTGQGRGHSARPALGSTVVASSARPARTTLLPDPEASRSFPEAPSSPAHALAKSPAAAATNAIAAGAPTDAQVRQELKQMRDAVNAERATPPPGLGAPSSIGGGRVQQTGNARAPHGAPLAVARIMAAGNAIATFPYRFGGGHASFVDNAYDCSGSVSYALAAAGLVGQPMTSGELMSWGAPGPGKWVSVYATAGHTYMYVAGLRFDTSGRDGPFGSRWQAAARDNSRFVVRHWPGL
jgi:cell wall-associated NlpC family hydrolase